MTIMRQHGSHLKLCLQSILVLGSLAGCSGAAFFDDGFPFSSGSESSTVRPVGKDDLVRARFFLPSEPVKKLPAPKLLMTPEVQRELNYFLRHDAKFVFKGLERRAKYYPMLRQVFEDEGLPHDLMNVALIESCFDVNAKSYAGAVGMWQFMKSTARLYGLRIGLFEDQRKDPILSTIAAARHLKDLYFAYDDWLLALGAYNAGSGFIDRALIRTGAKDFWSLARSGRLRKQTVQYVARFVAASLIINKPERFGVDKDRLSQALASGVSFPDTRYVTR